ncbi:hypothetical protein T07_5885 [Trichinella nelsoni]|uniref:Uncharacterized protein n=1 Tax=Trichinella nelsoni TaxID=6336 RepID=A0A0V0RSN8_9BILA|nr:hypothetical protein T07_5885 [Trichinella nelsoni]
MFNLKWKILNKHRQCYRSTRVNNLFHFGTMSVEVTSMYHQSLRKVLILKWWDLFHFKYEEAEEKMENWSKFAKK